MRPLLLIAVSAGRLFAQLPAPNDAGVSLGHLHLLVADPDAQKKLWVDILGAEVTHTGTLEMLRLPGIYVVIGKARTAPTEGTDGSTVNHIGFLVKDLAGHQSETRCRQNRERAGQRQRQADHGEVPGQNHGRTDG